MRRKLFETPQQHVSHAFHKTSKVSPVASAALHALHTRNIEASTALQTHILNHPKLNPQSHHVSSTQVQKRKYTKFIWIYSIGGSNIWQQIGTKIGTRLNFRLNQVLPFSAFLQTLSFAVVAREFLGSVGFLRLEPAIVKKCQIMLSTAFTDLQIGL